SNAIDQETPPPSVPTSEQRSHPAAPSRTDPSSSDSGIGRESGSPAACPAERASRSLGTFRKSGTQRSEVLACTPCQTDGTGRSGLVRAAETRSWSDLAWLDRHIERAES